MKSKRMIWLAALAIGVAMSGTSNAADHSRSTLQTVAPHAGVTALLAASRYGQYRHSRYRYQYALPFSYRYGYGSRHYGYGSRGGYYRYFGYPSYSYGPRYRHNPHRHGTCDDSNEFVFHRNRLIVWSPGPGRPALLPGRNLRESRLRRLKYYLPS